MGIPDCNDCVNKRNKAFIVIKFLIMWENRGVIILYGYAIHGAGTMPCPMARTAQPSLSRNFGMCRNCTRR